MEAFKAFSALQYLRALDLPVAATEVFALMPR